MRLASKIALVTGAARGIGAAIADAFAREGAIVWVTDSRDEEGAACAARIGGSTSYRHLDVREEDCWISVLDEVVARDG